MIKIMNREIVLVLILIGQQIVCMECAIKYHVTTVETLAEFEKGYPELLEQNKLEEIKDVRIENMTEEVIKSQLQNACNTTWIPLRIISQLDKFSEPTLDLPKSVKIKCNTIAEWIRRVKGPRHVVFILWLSDQNKTTGPTIYKLFAKTFPSFIKMLSVGSTFMDISRTDAQQKKRLIKINDALEKEQTRLELSAQDNSLSFSHLRRFFNYAIGTTVLMSGLYYWARKYRWKD